MRVRVNLEEVALDMHDYAVRRAQEAGIEGDLAWLLMLEACLVGLSSKGLTLDDVLMLVRKKWHQPRARRGTP